MQDRSHHPTYFTPVGKSLMKQSYDTGQQSETRVAQIDAVLPDETRGKKVDDGWYAWFTHLRPHKSGNLRSEARAGIKPFFLTMCTEWYQWKKSATFGK